MLGHLIPAIVVGRWLYTTQNKQEFYSSHKQSIWASHWNFLVTSNLSVKNQAFSIWSRIKLSWAAPKRLEPIFILRFEICASMVLKLTPRVRAISLEVRLRNKPRHTSCSVGVMEKVSSESRRDMESYCELLTDKIWSFVRPVPFFLLHISTKSDLQESSVFKKSSFIYAR